MLVQVAFLVFGIFAVLSLVIDMGYATLTRVQMQNAAESAALEGLRLRNTNLENGFEADCERRIAARDVVHWTFDDDFALGADAYQFGAGPIIGLSGGAGDLNAHQTLSIPDVPVYKPDLQLNQTTPGIGANFEHGDMVSGTFTYTTDSGPSEDAANPGGGPYSRNDFTASAVVPGPDPGFTATGCPGTVPEPWPTWTTPPEPAGPLIGPGDTAFLVRLRRTSERDDLADVAGVSSTGPALPLLFGRGTTIEAADATAGYSPRVHGLTVRAAAIADARPAMRVGLPQPAAGMNGVTPFAISRDFFLDPQTPPDSTISNARIGADGTILRLSDLAEVGRFVAGPSMINTVGQPLPLAAAAPVCDPAATPEASTIKGFGPVYQPIGPSLTARIVGFGRIELFWPNCAGDPTAVQVATHAQIVATANATSSLADGFPSDVATTDIPELLIANRSLAGGLLVAVLAR